MPDPPALPRRLAIPVAGTVLAAAVVTAGVLRADEVLLVFGLLVGVAVVLTWPGRTGAGRGRRAGLVRGVVALLVLALGLGLPLVSARSTATAGVPLRSTDLDAGELGGRGGSPPVVRTSAATGYLDSGDTIRLLDTAEGVERWSAELPGTSWTAPGGDLVTSDRGRVVRTDGATGRPRWEQTFDAEGDDARPVAADAEIVVVQTCAVLDDDWPLCTYQGIGLDGEPRWSEQGRELRPVSVGGVNTFAGDRPGGLVGPLPSVLATLAVEPYSPDLLLRSPADGSLQQQIERPGGLGPAEAGPADGTSVERPEAEEGLPAVTGDTLLRSERDGDRCRLTAYREDTEAWSSEVGCFSFGGGVLAAPQLDRGFVQQQRLWYYLDELDRDAATVDLTDGQTRVVGPLTRWDSPDEHRATDLVPGPGLLLRVDGTGVTALAPTSGDPIWQHEASSDGGDVRVRRAWVGEDVVALWTTPAPSQLFLAGSRTDELSVYDARTGTLRERLPFDPRSAGSALLLWDRLLVIDPDTVRLLG